MIRRVLAVVMAVVVLTSLGASATWAQALMSANNLSGQALDAAGRSVAGERVELLRDSQVIAVTTTNAHGAWSFDVAPGDYVVRVVVNGKIAGVRVSVGAKPVTGTLVVVPAAAASPQIGTLASLVANLAVTTAATVTTVALNVAVETETTELDPVAVITIINNLEPAEKLAFAQAVVDALGDSDELPPQLQTLQIVLVNTVIASNGNNAPIPPSVIPSPTTGNFS